MSFLNFLIYTNHKKHLLEMLEMTSDPSCPISSLVTVLQTVRRTVKSVQPQLVVFTGIKKKDVLIESTLNAALRVG